MKRILLAAVLISSCAVEEAESQCDAAEQRIQECFETTEPLATCDEAEAERVAAMSCEELQGEAADTKSDGCPLWASFIPLVNRVCDDEPDEPSEPSACNFDDFPTCDELFVAESATRTLRGQLECTDETPADGERFFVSLSGFEPCVVETDTAGAYTVEIPTDAVLGKLETCLGEGWPFRAEFDLPADTEPFDFDPNAFECTIQQD